LVTDAGRTARRNWYASRQVRLTRMRFRVAMEPLGAGHDLMQLIADASNAPTDGEVLERQTKAADGRDAAARPRPPRWYQPRPGIPANASRRRATFRFLVK
jgi:hypothetical protein